MTIYQRLEDSRAGRKSVYVILDSEQVRSLREERGHKLLVEAIKD
jgi:hypothetical protein